MNNFAACALVGSFYAGPHITSEIELSEANGRELGNFSVTRAYSDIFDISCLGLFDMEELARRVGEASADAIISWTTAGTLQSSE